MPVGGFAGTDPSPTLQDFIARVKDGKVCYFLTHDDFLEAQGDRTAAVEISAWVKSNFDPELVDGQTLYDLKAKN